MQSILQRLVRRQYRQSDSKTKPKPKIGYTLASNNENLPRLDAGLADTLSLSSASLDDVANPPLRGPRLRKFFSYYRHHLDVLAADLVCAVLVAATTLALPLCANFILKRLTSTTDQSILVSEIYGLGGVMLLLIGVQALSSMFVDYRGHVMGAQMETAMRKEMFEHYHKLSFSFYDRQRVGQLMSRISNDLFALSELYHHGPEDIAISVLKSLGASLILWYLDPLMTLVILVSVPLAVFYALFFNHRMGTAQRQGKERIAAINELVEDSLSGVRVVRAFSGEALEIKRFDQENKNFLNTRRQGYRAEAFFSVGLGTYTQLLTLLVIVFGTVAILQASMSVADLMTFLLCIAILTDPIARAANFARLWQEGITGFHRFMEVMEMTPEIQDSSDAHALENTAGAVSFRNVSFHYSTTSELALCNISLDIQPGEFVALVGQSGVGKTTLCSLIPRFYDATSGDVLVDGHNVKGLTLDSLRRNIGVVHQDIYLFAGTVAENIAYGRPDATREEIIGAAIEAQADEFIRSLPQGYDTDIGERGVQLSGGQKQRLTIARTFIKDPAILIFDEATSALDSESERAVQEALHRIAANRTTIVIAHRLSTIMKADRILVLTEDGIVEQGTHTELMAAQGAYYAMHRVHVSV
ncbi:MAG: ATP-binding cassette subfamily B protein [Candidatus Azotimanducaceae bacterium]|jgi:ATP-binding cassette subfamily B protein